MTFAQHFEMLFFREISKLLIITEYHFKTFVLGRLFSLDNIIMKSFTIANSFIFINVFLEVKFSIHFKFQLVSIHSSRYRCKHYSKSNRQGKVKKVEATTLLKLFDDCKLK